MGKGRWARHQNIIQIGLHSGKYTTVDIEGTWVGIDCRNHYARGKPNPIVVTMSHNIMHVTTNSWQKSRKKRNLFSSETFKNEVLERFFFFQIFCTFQIFERARLISWWGGDGNPTSNCVRPYQIVQLYLPFATMSCSSSAWLRPCAIWSGVTVPTPSGNQPRSLENLTKQKILIKNVPF